MTHKTYTIKKTKKTETTEKTYLIITTTNTPIQRLKAFNPTLKTEYQPLQQATPQPLTAAQAESHKHIYVNDDTLEPNYKEPLPQHNSQPATLTTFTNPVTPAKYQPNYTNNVYTSEEEDLKEYPPKQLNYEKAKQQYVLIGHPETFRTKDYLHLQKMLPTRTLYNLHPSFQAAVKKNLEKLKAQKLQYLHDMYGITKLNDKTIKELTQLALQMAFDWNINKSTYNNAYHILVDLDILCYRTDRKTSIRKTHGRNPYTQLYPYYPAYAIKQILKHPNHLMKITDLTTGTTINYHTPNKPLTNWSQVNSIYNDLILQLYNKSIETPTVSEHTEELYRLHAADYIDQVPTTIVPQPYANHTTHTNITTLTNTYAEVITPTDIQHFKYLRQADLLPTLEEELHFYDKMATKYHQLMKDFYNPEDPTKSLQLLEHYEHCLSKIDQLQEQIEQRNSYESINY